MLSVSQKPLYTIFHVHIRQIRFCTIGPQQCPLQRFFEEMADAIVISVGQNPPIPNFMSKFEKSDFLLLTLNSALYRGCSEKRLTPWVFGEGQNPPYQILGLNSEKKNFPPKSQPDFRRSSAQIRGGSRPDSARKSGCSFLTGSNCAPKT